MINQHHLYCVLVRCDCYCKVIEDLGSNVCLPKHIQKEFSAKIWSEDSLLGSQLRGSSLVIGMHPDQATDGIVDFAMKYRKSFAVIPCCVFPR